MRRLAGLLVVPLLLLSAVACGDDKASDSASSTNGAPAITAGEKFGEKPTLAKGEGDPPKELKTEVVSEGDGAKLKNGDAIQVNYLGQAWDSTKPFDNSFDRKQPFDLTLGAGMVIQGWDKGLVGQKVGSRVELVIPPDLGYGKQGQGEDIKPDATLVFVVDILKATQIPASAKGTAVAQDNIDLPKVGTNTDGKAPSVKIPKVDPPKKLVSDYVLEAKGDVVKETDSVVVNYVALVWKDGKTFDSTYQTGKTQTFPLAQVTLKGLKDGLIGKTVGSRVLLVVPPDQGFADQEQQGIPANSTLVFAVDILAKM
ncbi:MULTISPECIES: FKBP-type peptidyl-prolyl cis-trans isomerase [unclassified Streptomyces]|uniref:FKBP-type peptidyl-prolyl cis-trans isomerase n=1 Tax=Streptomyces TaxID=1883 RepID=UPI0001C1BB21|nr:MULTISPECIES: FKBP-type peptidyl-prolyl cis-trans isomerase [unclassified Streptomyces]MYR69009.1 FKBP-type peptidyl-prolyl cis-trans isomerase [Streptomyces sp. SID4939]MYS02758.1 FKBP-type peptidyl-prolyl cis-trans isomerase [Streptomyces sp. SID4940]MYT62657.1 FKBP-type peptidyl-prolyl cis-trans isomerase [Streptomyces sp. SID8357]MYT86224.1 FKBP-type peptidyl-prolyl cis-trans isomerase [Streptomyces sp. SID8360]MYU32022.1 FKBP-type peptidyl-prolyl cis-trans isomerase [Streptomyces sp. S